MNKTISELNTSLEAWLLKNPINGGGIGLVTTVKDVEVFIKAEVEKAYNNGYLAGLDDSLKMIEVHA